MIGIELTDNNTWVQVVNTTAARGYRFPVPQGLTSGGIGLPAVPDLIYNLNEALQALGLQNAPDAHVPAIPDIAANEPTADE